MNEQKTVMLVEDSADDARLFLRAVRQSGYPVTVEHATDADEARMRLRESTPTLIVLDCHLPGDSGITLLEELRLNWVFSRTPIVMMSSTESTDDVGSAYAFGINSFLRKPACFEGYMATVRLLLDYWLAANVSNAIQPPVAPLASVR